MARKQKFLTCLWFEDNAEEAAKFYTSIFKKGKITDVMKGPDGKAVAVNFRLHDQDFVALNGRRGMVFNPSMSVFVRCENQREVDRLWKKLTDGGQESMCGWLEDKYGVSWQIIPNELPKLLGSKNKDKAQRAMQAMLQMKKIDVDTLKRAAKGKPDKNVKASPKIRAAA
jgi:predicted 3-demethylubiquinone-9 3-methyltransferase (glyoxalase superfamily)